MGQVEGIRGWLVEVSTWDPFCVTRRKEFCYDFGIIIKLIGLLKTTFKEQETSQALRSGFSQGRTVWLKWESEYEAASFITLVVLVKVLYN